MRGYVLEICDSFQCMAGDCPDTCCSGWKIVVDHPAWERFRKIENRALKEDILSHIVEESGVYRFQNRSSGDCAMLDEDGLCRIQRNLSEEELCNTCRKYPRLSAKIDDTVWIAMAASCPVIAGYLCTEKVEWRSLEQGTSSVLPLEEEVHRLLHPWYNTEKSSLGHKNQSYAAERGLSTQIDHISFDQFVDVAMDCLEIVLSYSECSYLEGSFDLYQEEGDQSSVLQRYLQETKPLWRHFFENYVRYRLPCRYLEFPQETLEHRGIQVMGELLLIRVILCSMVHVAGTVKDSDLQRAVRWVYRLSAHGEKMGQEVHACFVRWKDTMLQMAYPDELLEKDSL